jgi:hypothetical protein
VEIHHHHQSTTVHCWTKAPQISRHLARFSATRIQQNLQMQKCKWGNLLLSLLNFFILISKNNELVLYPLVIQAGGITAVSADIRSDVQHFK